MSVLEAAKRYTDAGISVIPIRTDGSRAPSCTWTRYQTMIATADELESWWGNGLRQGIAVIGGAVSGGLEIIDFDKPGIVDQWVELVDRECGGLLKRLPRARTPTGGDHFFFRSAGPGSCQELAMAKERFIKYTDADGECKYTQVIIETKGEGGYVLVRPSPAECHPTGRIYKAVGRVPLSAVPTICDDERDILLSVARQFDERPAVVDKPDPPPRSTPSDFVEAAREYNLQHSRDWKDVGGRERLCPVCEHKGCFGPMPDDDSRWACFSTNHSEAGIQGRQCWHGDALDVDAYQEGIDRVLLLRREGYLAELLRPPPGAPPPDPDEPGPPEGGKPSYTYRQGEGHDAIAFALGVLTRVPIVYQQARRLVTVAASSAGSEKDSAGVRRAAGAPMIAELSSARLWEILSAEVNWLRWDPRKKENVKRDPPNQVSKNLFARGEYPGVREIFGVVTVPVLRPDGTVYDVPGYDDSTGLVYVATDRLPEIPDKPTKDEVHGALDALLDMVADFPFASEADRSAWFAAMLTPIAYPSFRGGAPLFLIDASTPGTGKTLAADVIGIIASGSRMARSPYVRDDDELRKRITSHVIAGDSMALIDNVPSGGFVGWPSLDMALTAGEWVDRVLGKSENVRRPMNVCWYSTGNNVSVKSDAGRRVVRIRLETDMERPEDRTGFRHDPLMPWVRKNRPRLLAGALTILRGFFAAGAPTNGLTAVGSFEGWSDVVRCCVVWLGLEDPIVAFASRDPDIDPDVAAHKRLLLGLKEAQDGQLTLGDPTGMNSREILDAAKSDKPGAEMLRDAAMELSGGKGTDLPTPRRFSYVLRKYKGRRRAVDVGGQMEDLSLESCTDRTGTAKWVVRCMGCRG